MACNFSFDPSSPLENRPWAATNATPGTIRTSVAVAGKRGAGKRGRRKQCLFSKVK